MRAPQGVSLGFTLDRLARVCHLAMQPELEIVQQGGQELVDAGPALRVWVADRSDAIALSTIVGRHETAHSVLAGHRQREQREALQNGHGAPPARCCCWPETPAGSQTGRSPDRGPGSGAWGATSGPARKALFLAPEVVFDLWRFSLVEEETSPRARASPVAPDRAGCPASTRRSPWRRCAVNARAHLTTSDHHASSPALNSWPSGVMNRSPMTW